MGTLVCTVELSKTNGVTVKVENADGKITQTFVLDGTSITTTCKGNEQTSTITQKQDSIKIVCKDFTIEAETITCKSTKATSHKSEDVFGIESTKAMTIKSSDTFDVESTKAFNAKSTDALTVKSTKAMLLDSMDTLDLKALKAMSAKGTMDVVVEATMKLGLKGTAGAKLESPAQVEVEGLKLGAKGTGMTEVGGGIIKIG